MPYKKKLIVLLTIIGSLVLIYTISLLFDPEVTGTRSASYVWLDSRLAARAARIVISNPGQDANEFIKRDGKWFIVHDEIELPVRQLRVEDFLGIFTSRASWPVRSTTAASHPRLGLDVETASRVTIYGENSTLLDILLGSSDVTGREINVRRHGQNEVRSGDNLIRVYILGTVNSWFNLRLIPESEDGRISVNNVQRLSVFKEGETQIFSRRNREWVVSGISVASPDQSAIESYIRTVLNTEGDDFVHTISGDDPIFNYCRIVLELGDGSIRTIRLTEPTEESFRIFASVDNSGFVYSISPWAARRLFRTASDFERQ
jgi:hypothetical protein